MYPDDYTKLKIGGATIKIVFPEIDIKSLGILIAQGEAREREEKQKILDLKARIAANEKEVRNQANQFRRDLHRQLEIVRVCPYCGGVLSASNAHLDHIYPVSKGGRSLPNNLVFVCEQCNLNKSDLTLRTFLATFSLAESLVYERLERLRKDF